MIFLQTEPIDVTSVQTKQLIYELTFQTKEWSDLVARQMTEEHEIRKTHVLQQTELLKKLIEDAQAVQLKEMELRQER